MECEGKLFTLNNILFDEMGSGGKSTLNYILDEMECRGETALDIKI